MGLGTSLRGFHTVYTFRTRLSRNCRDISEVTAALSKVRYESVTSPNLPPSTYEVTQRQLKDARSESHNETLQPSTVFTLDVDESAPLAKFSLATQGQKRRQFRGSNTATRSERNSRDSNRPQERAWYSRRAQGDGPGSGTANQNSHGAERADFRWQGFNGCHHSGLGPVGKPGP